MSTPVIAVIVIAILVLFFVLRGRDESVQMPRRAAPADPETIESAIRSGRTIEAIKLYREQHGVGLREAKDAIEEMARTAPAQ